LFAVVIVAHSGAEETHGFVVHCAFAVAVEHVLEVLEHLVAELVLHHFLHGVALVQHCLLAALHRQLARTLHQHLQQHPIKLQVSHAHDGFDDLRTEFVG